MTQPTLQQLTDIVENLKRPVPVILQIAKDDDSPTDFFIGNLSLSPGLDRLSLRNPNDTRHQRLIDEGLPLKGLKTLEIVQDSGAPGIVASLNVESEIPVRQNIIFLFTKSTTRDLWFEGLHDIRRVDSPTRSSVMSMSRPDRELSQEHSSNPATESSTLLEPSLDESLPLDIQVSLVRAYTALREENDRLQSELALQRQDKASESDEQVREVKLEISRLQEMLSSRDVMVRHLMGTVESLLEREKILVELVSRRGQEVVGDGMYRVCDDHDYYLDENAHQMKMDCLQPVLGEMAE